MPNGVSDEQVEAVEEERGDLGPSDEATIDLIPGEHDEDKGDVTIKPEEEPVEESGDEDEEKADEEGAIKSSQTVKEISDVLTGLVARVEEIKRGTEDVTSAEDTIQESLATIDYEALTNEESVKLGLTATKKLVEAQETRITEQMKKVVSQVEVTISRSIHGDFDDLLEGREGIREFATENPHWPIEKCYQMASRLRGGTEKDKEVDKVAKKGSLDLGGEQPSGKRMTGPSKTPGAAGELTVDGALDQALKELGIK